MYTIESDRLILQPLTLDDTGFVIELLNTEGYLRYIANRHVKTAAQAEEYLKKGPLTSYELNGFGLGLVRLKDTGQSIGMCGLLKRDYLDHPDLGFAFLPAYTGKGYAFEIACATVHHAFSYLGLKKIFGITLPENFTSIRLLQKIGFVYVRNFIVADTKEELSLYSIEKKIIEELTSE